MANLGEFLNALFTNAGVEIENDTLKNITTKSATVEIDQALVDKFNQNYLTLNSAKNNPELKKHFYAVAMNGLDTELETTMTELSLTEDVINEIRGEKSSFKKASLLAKKIKSLEAEKSSATTKTDKAEIQAKIDSLNAEVVRVRAEKEQAVKEVEARYKNEINDILLSNTFGSYDFALPTSKDANVKLAKSLFMEEVTKKGYNIALDNNEFKLVTADGMDVYENNQRVGFKDFTDRLLAQHKLLKVAGEQTPANQQTQTQTTTTVQTGNRTNRFSSRAEELAAEALRDLNS
jgi:predicted nucleic acid-binding protein